VFDHLDLPLLILDDVSVSVFGFVLDTVIVEPFDGVYVGETQERSCGSLEVRVELLDKRAGVFIFKEAIDCFANLWGIFRFLLNTWKWTAYDSFDVAHKIVESDKR
jgi:hypothetical protein